MTQFSTPYSLKKINIVDNPHPNWCPYANCTKRKICKPCNRRYLFLLAESQSKAIKVQEMINLLPGIRIRGTFTDYTFLERMAKSLVDVTTLKHADSLSEVFGHNPYPENHLMCASQFFVQELDDSPLNVQDQSKIIGFRTSVVKKYSIKFLVQNFPCARFIFSVKSNATAHADNYKDGNYTFERIPHYYRKVLQRLGEDRVYLMNMEDWWKEYSAKNDLSQFTKLSKWLGYRNCYFKTIEGEETIDVGDSCRFG